MYQCLIDDLLTIVKNIQILSVLKKKTLPLHSSISLLKELTQNFLNSSNPNIVVLDEYSCPVPFEEPEVTPEPNDYDMVTEQDQDIPDYMIDDKEKNDTFKLDFGKRISKDNDYDSLKRVTPRSRTVHDIFQESRDLSQRPIEKISSLTSSGKKSLNRLRIPTKNLNLLLSDPDSLQNTPTTTALQRTDSNSDQPVNVATVNQNPVPLYPEESRSSRRGDNQTSQRSKLVLSQRGYNVDDGKNLYK